MVRGAHSTGRRARRSALSAAAIAIIMSLTQAAAASAKPPEVERVTPNAGSTAGGTEVVITGKVLAPNGPCSFSFVEPTCPELMVYFGNEPGFIFEATKTKILAFSASHTAGTVDVTVVSPMGTSAITKGDKFTYSGPPPVEEPGEAPVVSAVEPAHGPKGGFNRVIIRGEHLTPNNSACLQCSGDIVHFGSRNVAVSQGTPTHLLVIAPPHAPETVNVTVTTNPGATSAITPSDSYKFE